MYILSICNREKEKRKQEEKRKRGKKKEEAVELLIIFQYAASDVTWFNGEKYYERKIVSIFL